MKLFIIILFLAVTLHAQMPPLPMRPTNSVRPVGLTNRPPLTNVSSGKSVEFWFTASTNCAFTLQWSTNSPKGPWTNVVKSMVTFTTNGVVLTNRYLILTNFPKQYFRLVTNQ